MVISSPLAANVLPIINLPTTLGNLPIAANGLPLSSIGNGIRLQVNMDIQPVFNECKAVAYVCSYFSKSEDKCSFVMRQAASEAFDSKLDQFNAMKNILKPYTSNRECSVQEAVYHILQKLHLRRVFPGVQLVNTNYQKNIQNTSIKLLARRQD